MPGTSRTASSSRPRTTRRATAASSTTRRTAAPPTATSPTASRRAPTSCSRDTARVQRVAYDRARAAATTRVHDFLDRLRRGSAEGRRRRRDRARPHQAGRRPDGRRQRPVLDPHRRALPSGSRGGQPDRRPAVRVHAARPRRQDPDGLLQPLRDGQPARAARSLRRRVRQRHRRRPPRHRHPGRGADEPQSLSRRRHRLPLHPPRRLAGARRGRQDAGVEHADRSRRRAPSGATSARSRSASSGSSPACCDGTLGFGGEESAGATFLRRDGRVWTTDKDGLILDLLAAEITAVTGKDPGAHYERLRETFGDAVLRARRRPRHARREGRARQARPRGGHAPRRWPAIRSSPS